MRKININNPEELKKFKMETTGFVSSYGFPYRLDDLTEKGANYTIFCPLRWKSAFSPAKLHKMLRDDVDADKIYVEYIDFVKEDTIGQFAGEKKNIKNVNIFILTKMELIGAKYLNAFHRWRTKIALTSVITDIMNTNTSEDWYKFIKDFKDYMKGE